MKRKIKITVKSLFAGYTRILLSGLICLYLLLAGFKTPACAAEPDAQEEPLPVEIAEDFITDEAAEDLFADPGLQEDPAPEAEESSGASGGAGSETNEKKRSAKKADADGLIEDPEGNASIDDITFEVTDSWAAEEMEREAREEQFSAGIIYPPAPFIRGISAFRQGDARWGLHPYGYANSAGTIPATIASSGCGIVSLVNAVYYMTGEMIDPARLADWSVAHGFRQNGVGTVHSLYQAYAKAFGKNYGFEYAGTASSLAQIRSFLHDGGTAIISTTHHLLAVADYDPDHDSYLLLDSAPSSARGTYPTGYRYLSSQAVAESIPVYAIVLLRRTGHEQPETSVNINEMNGILDQEELFIYLMDCYYLKQPGEVYMLRTQGGRGGCVIGDVSD